MIQQHAYRRSSSADDSAKYPIDSSAKTPTFRVNKTRTPAAAGTALPTPSIDQNESIVNIVADFFGFADFADRRGDICRANGLARCDSVSLRCATNVNVDCVDANGTTHSTSQRFTF